MSPKRRYTFGPAAARDLRKLDPTTQRRVFDGLDGVVDDPPRGDVKKLQGSDDEWRLRVGTSRIRFVRHRLTRDVYVLSIEPRDRAYR